MEYMGQIRRTVRLSMTPVPFASYEIARRLGQLWREHYVGARETTRRPQRL